MNYAVLLVGLSILISCSQQQREEGREAMAAADSIQQLPPAQTKQDTLKIEGMDRAVELQLYRSPADWPLRFYTYLPSGIEASRGSSGEGETLHFNMNEAVLSLFVFPEGVTKSQAQPLAMEALGTDAVQACDNNWGDWQWGCYYATDAPERVARIYMGEQGGRFFYFLLRYPAEYGDGFAPRAALILENLKMGEEGVSE